MMIALLILGLALVQLLVWAAIRSWLRARLRRLRDEMRAHCVRSGETLLLEPTSASFSGSGRDRVRGNGVLGITRERLRFWKAVGPRIELAHSQMLEVREERSFRGRTALAAGGSFVVVRLADGDELGFLVRDATGVLLALRAR